METPTFIFLLEELTTMLVLEKRFLATLALLGPDVHIARLISKHKLVVQRLERKLHAYEKFTKPGHYQL